VPGRGALGAREEHDDRGVGIGAEPLLAGEPPARALGRRDRREPADVGAALLLRHELGTLGEPRHVGLGEPVEVRRLERRVPEARQEHGRAVGDIDRTAEAELGLIEEIGERVLGDGGVGRGPAEDARAVRHGVDAELPVGDALELSVRRVVLDPLLVAPEPVAVVQDRHVPVGQARAVVQLVARERAQAVEMRLDMTSERRGKVDLEQVRERAIRPEEVEPGGVGRDQARQRLAHRVP
jgi:hypothetical protein